MSGTAQPSVTCPRCQMTSYNPNDIREGYCGNCHDWTGAAPASRHRFADELAGHERALIAISGEAPYNVQVHLIFDVLDTVDEIADKETAGPDCQRSRRPVGRCPGSRRGGSEGSGDVHPEPDRSGTGKPDAGEGDVGWDGRARASGSPRGWAAP